MVLRVSPSIVFATRPGGQTIDQDAWGGNPFATALIETAAAPSAVLSATLEPLQTRVAARTQGVQVPEWQLGPAEKRWRLLHPPGPTPAPRMALVLVAFSYASADLSYLAGAAVDERRVAAFLAQQGFTVWQGVVCTRQGIAAALTRYARHSSQARSALIYCTGHGIMVGDESYLLPTDYPSHKGYGGAAVRRHAVPVQRIALANRAQRENLTLFAGCRSGCDAA